MSALKWMSELLFPLTRFEERILPPHRNPDSIGGSGRSAIKPLRACRQRVFYPFFMVYILQANCFSGILTESFR